MEATPTVIAQHIPIATGAAFTQAVERQYLGQPVLTFSEDHRQDFAAFMAMPEAKRAQLRAIIGYVPFGVHNYLPTPATYVTVLRDPIQRTIANYYEIISHPRHPLHQRYREMSLADFARVDGRSERQTRWIVGLQSMGDGYMHNDLNPLPSDALGSAKRHLNTYYTVVGVAEMLDAAILMMQHKLGWGTVLYARRHPSIRYPHIGELSPDVVRVLEDHTQPDLELYHHARKLFEEQISEYGVRFADDLRAFRRRNALFGRVWHASRTFRETAVYRRVRRLGVDINSIW